ncbi:MAG: hypothetical protein AAB300_04195 [Nitrospirota bacterium]
MEKNIKNPLEVIQEVKDDADASKPEEAKAEKGKREKFELPSGYLLAKEMRELFEEDIVTHVQGPSEPEGD